VIYLSIVIYRDQPIAMYLHINSPPCLLSTQAFIWRPDRHHEAPESIKQALKTVTMIRSLVAESPLSLLPNELLFEIFVLVAPW